jgi:lipopolysaccharide/colanic/teichoic acid biosynthesis glycosyltransferase
VYRVVKRIIDILIAVVTLLLLSPLLIPIAIILRLTGEGEIFFRQKRIGYKNREFYVWKFATMLKNSPATGTITAKHDPRILPIGRFLRDTKINELPQLINVLTGDMSIVGPRPLTEEAYALYPDELKPLVYNAKAGVTGIGSVVFRNEEQILAGSGKAVRDCYREDIMPIKGALEVWYQQNISLLTDVKIILLTAIAILKPDNKLHLKWFKNLPSIATAA